MYSFDYITLYRTVEYIYTWIIVNNIFYIFEYAILSLQFYNLDIILILSINALNLS